MLRANDGTGALCLCGANGSAYRGEARPTTEFSRREGSKTGGMRSFRTNSSTNVTKPSTFYWTDRWTSFTDASTETCLQTDDASVYGARRAAHVFAVVSGRENRAACETNQTDGSCRPGRGFGRLAVEKRNSPETVFAHAVRVTHSPKRSGVVEQRAAGPGEQHGVEDERQ